MARGRHTGEVPLSAANLFSIGLTAEVAGVLFLVQQAK
jgi:hypothetical protein